MRRNGRTLKEHFLGVLPIQRTTADEENLDS